MTTRLNLFAIGSLLLFFACQRPVAPGMEELAYTNDLNQFENLDNWKTALKGVEIVALGENTHGLGAVFANKVELVRWLHQNMGFDLLLFESGFGDGHLAWENQRTADARDLMSAFTSYKYYQCEEMLPLFSYVTEQQGGQRPLQIGGIDCQPQQDHLVRYFYDAVDAVDTTFGQRLREGMLGLKLLYRYEYEKDSLSFVAQREDNKMFLEELKGFLKDEKLGFLRNGTTEESWKALYESVNIFHRTYGDIAYGELMGFPKSANVRDRSMFENVKWHREQYPSRKIIIWAQNSHIENVAGPEPSPRWMGHHLKEAYGDRYYSIGAIVYKGRDLIHWNNTVNEFEHDTTAFLAYHLHQQRYDRLLINLRERYGQPYLNEPLLGMESGGNTGLFVAKDRFDGLLFIRSSDVPTFQGEE
ncbi:MAG: erythromycin esterase family protein [Bacteroidota bacterium]